MEKRIVLKNCGLIDPDSIQSFIERDGFQALNKARTMTPEAVIAEIKASGLRGRGGAGFPTGLKLESTFKSPGSERYVICNADEGEVGTFKDRYILEHDPFTLIEAVAVAGYAVGSSKAYIYLRAEYRYLKDRLQNAITRAAEKGFLDQIKIEVCLGAGAYVCGEESALMESIEGKRGEVRYRPPFPSQSGLRGKPTVIINVETCMNLPQIVLNGSAWFNSIGTERSKGTKVFSITGDVKKPGVYELVMGTPLRELVEGLAEAENIKAVQIGGASGQLVPSSMLDTTLAFENLLGSGAITVFDVSRDIIDIVYRNLEFLAEESCGKCTPCRQGTEALVEIISKFAAGEGEEADIETLRELSTTMMLASMCGLGQAAPNSVLDGLQYFKEEFEKRIAVGTQRLVLRNKE